MAVQFADNVDMNSLKITELAEGVDPSDAVTVSQLSSAGPQGHAEDTGDGILFTYPVTHNLGTLDVMVQVYRKSDGVNVNTTVDRVDANTVNITFGLLPALNSHRVLVIPVPTA